LLVTGLFNFVTIVKANQIATSYHMLGGVKILVALVIFFFAAILAGKTALAESFRERMKYWLTVTMLIGVLIVIIGSVMRSYPRTPKPIEGPAIVAPN
jgi:cytochrome c biogenesis protein CcdA